MTRSILLILMVLDTTRVGNVGIDGPRGELSPYEQGEFGHLIAEHGPAFAAYAGHTGPDYATAEGFEEAYCGEWESEVAYAEELFDELYAHEIPELLRCYVDCEAFARDLFISDCYSVDRPEGGVYVFRNC